MHAGFPANDTQPNHVASLGKARASRLHVHVPYAWVPRGHGARECTVVHCVTDSVVQRAALGRWASMPLSIDVQLFTAPAQASAPVGWTSVAFIFQIGPDGRCLLYLCRSTQTFDTVMSRAVDAMEAACRTQHGVGLADCMLANPAAHGDHDSACDAHADLTARCVWHVTCALKFSFQLQAQTLTLAPCACTVTHVHRTLAGQGGGCTRVYVAPNLYAQHIELLLRYIKPSNVLVLFTQQLRADPAGVRRHRTTCAW